MLLWLALPTLILLPLVWLSTLWRLPTRVQLEVETSRLALILGGEERREVLNPSVPFSALVVEDCDTVTFAPEGLDVADPRQLVPGTEAGEAPHFPPAAWRQLQPAGPVKLTCRDPAAKLTLRHPDPGAARLGLLDRLYVQPGSHVILEVSPGREPALSLETGTPQDLTLALGPDLEIVTDLIEPEGLTVPFRGDLLTWRARLPEARRTLEIASSGHGLVLIVTPARGQAAELFPETLNLPLAALELSEENPRERAPSSSLRARANLSYPEYPAIPAVAIEKDEAVDLQGFSQARLRHLALDPGKGTLHAVFAGTARRVASGDRTSVRDNRLTLYHTFRHSWRLGLLAVAATWLVSTTWAAFGAWRKLRE